MTNERLQKILARAGLGSRRRCEELIAAGQVTLNGEVVTTPGTQADEECDVVCVDGEPLKKQASQYYMLNKPAGCLTTVRPDPWGRDTVMLYVSHLPVRVFPVGRLDFDTQGLLLFTNDGAFAQRVIHPRHEVIKTYEAVVLGDPTADTLEWLRTGVELGDGPTAPAKVKILGKRTVSIPVNPGKRRGGPVAELRKGTVLQIRIHEGRKRIVRRMLKKVGHPVVALRRTAIGTLGMGKLEPGKVRPLNERERERVFKAPKD